MTSPTTVSGPAALSKPTDHALLRVAAQERALRSAALQIFTQTNESALYKAALEIIPTLVQVDVVALFLTTNDERSPTCRAMRRHGATQLLPSNHAPVDALAAEALQQRTAVRRSSWVSPDGERFRSALAVPLEAQGAGVGALVVARQARNEFRDDHVRLLSVTAQLLAPALVRLQEEEWRNEFLSMASHELRTPLSALQGFTEIMLSREVPPNDQRSWLNMINQETVRLAALIEELLDLTRNRSSQVELKPALIQMADVISRVVRLLDSDGRRIQLVMERTPTVLADADKLEQVVTNLLRNACDYSPAARPVEVEIAHRCLAQQYHASRKSNGHARIGVAPDCRPTVSVGVRDEGAGMTAEELSRACQPFFRTEASQELAPAGSGLGLAIAKAIIERHQGHFWAHSQPGAGSAFGFCLPAQAEGAN